MAKTRRGGDDEPRLSESAYIVFRGRGEWIYSPSLAPDTRGNPMERHSASPVYRKEGKRKREREKDHFIRLHCGFFRPLARDNNAVRALSAGSFALPSDSCFSSVANHLSFDVRLPSVARHPPHVAARRKTGISLGIPVGIMKRTP